MKTFKQREWHILNKKMFHPHDNNEFCFKCEKEYYPLDDSYFCSDDCCFSFDPNVDIAKEDRDSDEAKSLISHWLLRNYDAGHVRIDKAKVN